MGHRYYDPTIGRFTQTRTLQDKKANAYLYVQGDPVNLVDPTGLHHTSWGDGGCSWSRESYAGLYSFHQPCTEHDRCPELGGSFDDCDRLFLSYMLSSCSDQHNPGYRQDGCYLAAADYYLVVSYWPWRS